MLQVSTASETRAAGIHDGADFFVAVLAGIGGAAVQLSGIGGTDVAPLLMLPAIAATLKVVVSLELSNCSRSC